MLIRSKQNSLVGLHGKTWWSCRDWTISRSQDSLPFLKSTGVPSNLGSCKSSNYLFPPGWNCTVSHRTTGCGGHCYIHSSGPRSSCLHKKNDLQYKHLQRLILYHSVCVRARYWHTGSSAYLSHFWQFAEVKAESCDQTLCLLLYTIVLMLLLQKVTQKGPF